MSWARERVYVSAAQNERSGAKESKTDRRAKECVGLGAVTLRWKKGGRREEEEEQKRRERVKKVSRFQRDGVVSECLSVCMHACMHWLGWVPAKP